MQRRIYLSLVYSFCAMVSYAQWDQSDTDTLWTEFGAILEKVEYFKRANHTDLSDINSLLQTLATEETLSDVEGLVGTIKDNSTSISSNVGSIKSKFDTFYEEYQRSVVEYTKKPQVLNTSNNINLTWDPYTYRTVNSISNSLEKTEDYNKQQLQVQKDILLALTNRVSSGVFTNFYIPFDSVNFSTTYSAETFSQNYDLLRNFAQLVAAGDNVNARIYYRDWMANFGEWNWNLMGTLLHINPNRLEGIDYDSGIIRNFGQWYRNALKVGNVNRQRYLDIYSRAYYNQYSTLPMFESWKEFGVPALSNLNYSTTHSFGQTPLSDVISEDGTYHTNAPVVQTFLSSIMPAGFSTPPEFTNAPLSALNQESVDTEKNDFQEKNDQLTSYISPVVARVNTGLSQAVQSVTSSGFGQSWTINGWSGFQFGDKQIGGFSTLAMNRPSHMPSFAFLGWCIRIVLYFTFIYAIVRKYVNQNKEAESNSSWTDDF